MRLFERLSPGQHLFVVFSRKKGFKYVSLADNVISMADFLKRRGTMTFDKIIIHFLNLRKIRFIQKCALGNIPVYWIIWGADLYNKLLEPKGFEMCFRSDASCSFRNICAALHAPFKNLSRRCRARKIMRFVRERVNYLVTDTTENDYEVFARYYPEVKRIPWRDFFYYPIDEILGEELMEGEVDGNNILLGNSGSLTNNHEYAFQYLKNLNLGDRKLIVPLSYSGSKRYKKTVMEKGKLLFGPAFYPLIDFLPLDRYNRLMKGAAVAVYAHWRQEAIGNIIIALYLGAKVFIAGRSPVYAWAKGHGLIVSELERINQAELDTPLTPQEREHNRTLLASLYNRERFYALTKESFQL